MAQEKILGNQLNLNDVASELVPFTTTDLVTDLSPQLGADLDTNGFNIVAASDGVDISINAGPSSLGGAPYAGDVTVTGGAGSSYNFGGGGGAFVLGGPGSSGNNAYGGDVTIQGGADSTGSNAKAGNVFIRGGNSTNLDHAGGSVTIQSGNNSGTASGTSVSISTPLSSNSAGHILMAPGAGENSGSVFITTSPTSGAGTDGAIVLKGATSLFNPELRFNEQSLNGLNYVALKAPADVTTSRTWVLPDTAPVLGHVLQTDGTGNLSFVVPASGNLNLDANENMYAGTGSGTALTGTATDNILLGRNAGTAVTTGDNNVVLGNNAGTVVTTANNMICIGNNAGTASNRNGTIFIGTNAGQNLVAGSGNYNLVLGYKAFEYQSGNSCTGNIIMGYKAASYVGATGAGCSYNLVIGQKAGFYMTTASDNITIGRQAGYSVTTGESNILIGSSSGGSWGGEPITGGNNIVLGDQSASGMQAAGSNIFIGRSTTSKIVNGYGNVIIGHWAGPTTDTSNQLFIGEGTNTNGDDTPLIHGDFTASTVTINGTLDATVAMVLPPYTVGTLPLVVEGGMIYVTDAAAASSGVGAQCFGRGVGSPLLTEWVDVTTGLAVV